MVKNVLKILLLILIMFIIQDCADVGDADVGKTVLVTASVSNNYLEQDVITNNDGSCTYNQSNSIIPSIVTNNITINVTPISDNILNPSPVSVMRMEISYQPLDNNFPLLEKYIIFDSKVIQPNTSLTFSVPVLDPVVLQDFAELYLAGISINYVYHVNVKIFLKEVNTNEDLEKNVRFNFSIKNIVTPEECSNIQGNTN